MVYQHCKEKIERFWGGHMNFYKMTKEELIATCRKLQSENNKLQDELDRLSDCYTEMENKYADAVNTMNDTNGIKDMEWFKFKLQMEGLWTSELESFIEYYLKFHNVVRG